MCAGPTFCLSGGSKVKVAREHFYGTGRAGDTVKRAAAAEPETRELQARFAVAPLPTWCHQASLFWLPLPGPQRRSWSQASWHACDDSKPRWRCLSTAMAQRVPAGG